MAPADLAYLSINDAAGGLRRKEFTPVELTRACLDRIQALDSRINAFITLTADRALSQARQAQQELAAGNDRGPLHGIPIGLKDLYATRGILTTGHSAVLQHWVPDEDATVTRKLAEAGAVLLGKLAMHEFAFGGPTVDAPWPPARNPWNLEHIPGGSSSGSGAALAAGFCHGAMGSDTGGSIRGPASHCNIVGLKPTYGRVSRHGVLPLSWSLDHAGPMTRTVEDAALMLQAIAGYDPLDPASADVPVPDFRSELRRGITGLRLGVPRAGWFDEGEGVDPNVEAAFDRAIKVLEGLGAELVPLDGRPFSQARKANQTILLAEAYAYHEATLQKTPELFGSIVRRRFFEGAFLSAADYIDAMRARSALNREIRAHFARTDAFVMPSMARTPEPFVGYDPDEANRRPNFNNVGNLTGLPAISVPCGFSPAGLPIGFQIVGPPFQEPSILRIAHAYQQATDWHTRRPEL